MRGSFEQPGDADVRRDTAETGDMAAEQEPLRVAWPEAACDRVRPLLETFHDGALSGADERFVREHVASCARCAARLRRFGEIDAVLRSVPAPRVGPELRTQLYARIAEAQQRRGIFARRGSQRTQEAHVRTGYRGGSLRPAAAGSAFGSGRPGLVVSWINGVAAIAVVALLVLLFNTLTGMPYRTTPSSKPARGQVIGTLAGLQKFSDYRAAYLDVEGRLRIVSASNRRVESGPALPNTGLLMRTPAESYYDVAVSQDGHYLAYVEGDTSVRDAATLPDGFGGPVAIADLTTGVVLSAAVRANDLSWSPDNRFLAAPDVTNPADITIIDATTGGSRRLAVKYDGDTQASVPLVAGWIDTTHIAVFYQHGDSLPTPTAVTPAASESTGPVQQSLGSMDMRTGVITYLADLPDPSDVFLSPDGQQALLAPNYSTTMASVIDTRTGASRELPGISGAFAGKFADLGAGGNWSLHSAWQPGTGHVLALSLAINSGSFKQQPGIWLLDLDHDSATLVAANMYPLAWIPGPPQALVICDPPQADSTGSYPSDGAGVNSKLYTLAPVEQGREMLPLAGGMVAFLGLVRTT